MSNYLIDTNIITALLKNNTIVLETIEKALLRGDQIFINGISYYEIKRGLLTISAHPKIAIFERFYDEFGTIWLANKGYSTKQQTYT